MNGHKDISNIVHFKMILEIENSNVFYFKITMEIEIVEIAGTMVHC